MRLILKNLQSFIFVLWTIISGITFSGCHESGNTADNCGDGVIDIGEECDGQNLNGRSCEGEGFYSGDLACSSNCMIDTTSCVSEGACGNGIVQSDLGEECEPDIAFSDTCLSLGYYDGELTCGNNCKYNIDNCARCGDFIVQNVETCDGSNLNGETCETLGYDYGVLACDPTSGCTAFDTSDCRKCGDGNIDSGETCDSTNLNSETCGSLGLGTDYPLYCDSTCHFAGCDSFPTIETGADFTCYLTPQGGSFCWGWNLYGQLGIDSLTDSYIPASVNTSNDFIQIKCGLGHTCSTTASGIAYCWGHNDYKQLGNDTTGTDCLTPSLVTGNIIFTHLAVGATHSCGLDSSGAAYCWGDNSVGQLGDDRAEDTSSQPAEVSGNHIFTSIASRNNHTCGISDTGETYCWGGNLHGQIGDNTQNEKNTPTLVFGSHNFKQVTAGGYHTCGITMAGETYCWGENSKGQLGNNSIDRALIPALIYGSYNFKDIALGSYHTCALTAMGDAYCWGGNAYGQLGDNSQNTRYVPTLVSGGYNFVSIAPGAYHTCGLTVTGELYCWGNNNHGQLGNNTTTNSLIPIKITIP